MNRRTFILALSFALLFAGITYAVNPSSPFRPADNIQDPTCLPTDSNCYVTYGLQTQTSGTPLYTDTKTINFGSGLTATDNTNGVITITASGGGAAVWGSITGTLANQTDLQSALNAKQATLVSGTNIKTVNGNTILGSGDITTGTVTSLAFTNGNGFTGSVSNSTTTPTLSLTLQNATTSQSGQLTSTDWNTFNGKQATLVSGTNIKTVNGVTLLGSGDIAIATGTTETASNGLTKVTNDIQLGGALTKNTQLTGAYTITVPTGNILIGGTTSSVSSGLEVIRAGSGVAMYASKTADPTGSDLGIGIYGDRVISSTTSSSQQPQTGVYGQIAFSNTSGFTNTAPGFVNLSGLVGTFSMYAATGNLSAGSGLFSAGSYYVNLGGSGNVDKLAGVRINYPTRTPFIPAYSGTVSNYYGLYIDSLNGSAAFANITNKYAIYQAGPDETNLFNGYVVLGAGYLNFSSTVGASGYGIRNNAGVIEYKNNAGSWAAFGGTSPISIGTSGNTLYSSGLSGTGQGNTSLGNNVILGANAGASSNASFSTFIGGNAGAAATNADHSVFLGTNTGSGATNASYSTLFGHSTGRSFAGNNIGANNIIIGTNISLPNATANAINLGGVLFGTGTQSDPNQQNAYITAQTSGRIGIAVVSPAATLDVNGDGIFSGTSRYLNFGTTTGSTGYGFRNNGGVMEFKNNAGSWATFGGGGSSISLRTNGTTNGSQSILNLIAGSNVTLTDNGSGGVTIASTGGGSSAISYVDNAYVGQTSGPNGDGTVGLTDSIFIGNNSGTGASAAQYSNFIGNRSGNLAVSATNSNFFGNYSGYAADNAFSSNFFGTNAGSDATNTYNSNFFGYQAGSDAINAANSIFIGTRAGGLDTVDNTVNQFDWSILLGNYTNTGGYSNSILIGGSADGSPISNTAANQFMLADSITNVRWRGVEYTLPSTQAAGAGYVLSNNGNGVLSWVAQSGGGGSSQWSNVSGGINYGSGIVGINNTAPSAFLDIKGGTVSSGGGSGYEYQQYKPSEIYPSGLGITDPVLDDATFSGTYSGSEDNVVVQVFIDTSDTVDTFSWQMFEGTILGYQDFQNITPIAGAANVPITGSSQLLANGISINFENVTGHDDGGGGGQGDAWLYGISSPGVYYQNVNPNDLSGTPSLDDATFSGAFTGGEGNYYLFATIDSEDTPDTFEWRLYEGSLYDLLLNTLTEVDSDTGVPITGSSQLLSNGMSITFGDTTGHTNGDMWGYAFTNNGAGGGGGVAFADLINARTAAGNSLFKVTGDGKVGIGQSTPTAMLDIQGIASGGGSGYSYEQLDPTDYGQPAPSLDDATFSGTYTGTEDNVVVTTRIDSTGTPDTFTWFMYAGSPSYYDDAEIVASGSSVAITGSPQLLADGISVTFGATTGHTVSLNDAWGYSITTPGIFYYDVNANYWTPSVEDATISGTYTGGESAVAVDVEIDDATGPDTFSWSISTVPSSYDNGDSTILDSGSGVVITPGTPQLLTDGMSVTFAADTGHAIGDHYAQVIVDNGAGSGGSTDLFSTRNSSGTQLFKIDGNGNLALSGTNSYINFSSTVGDTGYGIRSNAGVMEYKNSGGSWAAFGGGGSGGAISYIGTSYVGQTSGPAGNGSDEGLGNNVFIGELAGSGATNALWSNFIGYAAGNGAENVQTSNLIGAGAGAGVTNVASSNFIGANAGSDAINAGYSNFFGAFAGNEAANASLSNFFGDHTGYNAVDAFSSNFIGAGAGGYAANANNSNFIGYRAGQGATNAAYSTFIGYRAGGHFQNTSDPGAENAANSIFIGSYAGLDDLVDNTTDSDDFSILLGNNTSTGGFSNSIALGAYATNTAANQFMIGSATRPIDEVVVLGSGSQSCSIRPDTVGVLCSSDENLKTNILDLVGNDTLKNLLSVRTVSYNWNNTPDSNPQIGFIAQDLEKYFPTLVSTSATGYLQVNYAGITPILTKAIQEMNLNMVGIADLERENTWRDSLVAWLGSATNGIGSLFSKKVTTDELCVRDDEGETCLTRSQINSLLSGQSNTGSGGGTPAPQEPVDPIEDDGLTPEPAPEGGETPSAPETPADTAPQDVPDADSAPETTAPDAPEPTNPSSAEGL